MGRSPFPITNFRQVLTVFSNVLRVLDKFVLKLLLEIDALVAGLWQAIDGVHDEVEAVQIIEHRHIERRGDRTFFFVAADVQVLMVGATVGESVDQPGISVEREDDRFVFGEELVEIRVAQSVRMFALRLQFHQVDDVDDADF